LADAAQEPSPTAQELWQKPKAYSVNCLRRALPAPIEFLAA
jgi:hypothetical protein